MKADVLIQMPMLMEVQGDRALDLIEYTPEAAEYQVNGFTRPRLFLHDTRRQVNQALERMLRADDVSQFAGVFCQPADVVLERTALGDLRMKLSDTDVKVPSLMCWIVVGLEEDFPEYPSLIEEVQAGDEGHCAGLTIYPLEPEQMAAFIGAAEDASAGAPDRPE